MNYLIMVYLFILGAMIGSFLGCMGYRIPNKIKTTFPPSFCENCKHKLKWYMNIPIFSYIFLRGKCYYCKKPIGFIYFLSEIICAILFVVNYVVFGFTSNFFIATILTCILIVTMVSDFRYYYISDRVIILGLIGSLITLLIFESKILVFKYIMYGVILFAIMYLIKIIGNFLFKKESLGDGDIKLMGVIGASIGIINGLLTLFVGSVLGLLYSLIPVKNKEERLIPFGPFLIMGALITLYFSNYITYIIDNML
jgi:prepilin signal peptidase PulO-like enzyme (type II secretory pathway)